MEFNVNFKKPDMVKEAARTGGQIWILEILMFIGVFFVIQLVMGIPVSVVMVPLLFTSENYLTAAASGDMNAIVEASMEVATSDAMMITQLFATIITTGVTMLFCKFLQKRKMRTLGFKKPGMWKEYGVGMLIGLGMMTAIVLIGVVTGAMELQFNAELASAGSIAMLITMFVGFLIQGMSEEVLCRGYFLISLARKNGKVWMGIIVSSVAFAALHLGNSGIAPLAFVNLILFGVFAGVYFIRRGNIWGVCAIHSIWNFAQGNIFGVLVSGNDFGTTIFTSTINEEMTIINGGSFGLEGGILTTIVLAAATVITLCTKQKDIAEEEPIAAVEAV